MSEPRIVAHWGFVAETDESWVTGELLLRADGVLLRRYGGSRTSAGETTWSFGPWDVVAWWSGETDPTQAIRELKGRGYSPAEPGPVPIAADHAGPFPGVPPAARYL